LALPLPLPLPVILSGAKNPRILPLPLSLFCLRSFKSPFRSEAEESPFPSISMSLLKHTDQPVSGLKACAKCLIRNSQLHESKSSSIEDIFLPIFRPKIACQAQ
jgi:hypothetical protein